MKAWSRYLLNYRSMLVILMACTLGVSVYATFRAKARGISPNTTLVEALAAPADENVEVELVTILPTGFEPGELVRPAGRLVLMFDNQSGLQPLELRLERAGMPRVAEVRLGRKNDSTRILNLPAGVYQVTEAGHPEWNLRLTLTRR